jgi:type II secretory pathway component PulK
MRAMTTNKRGFAMLVALTLIVLVGAVSAALATLLAADARRTRDEATQAQLRQLMFAGEVTAREMLDQQSSGNQQIDVSLPAELARDGAMVKVRLIQNGGASRAIITARDGRDHIEREITR